MGICVSANEKNEHVSFEHVDTVSVFEPKSNIHIIADDVRENRMYLGIYLKLATENSIDIVECKNGTEVLSYKDLESVDVIWMDVRMPIMDGVACTRELRKRGHHMHIIGVTGDISEDNILLCKKSGMSMILTKPVTLELVQATEVVKLINAQKNLLQ